MKHYLSKLILLALFVCAGFTSSAQYVPLYAGSNYSSDLYVIDTTGGLYTIVETRTLSSDVGTVYGCFGLSLNAATGDMYILYNAGGDEDRNLGILDTLTGDITDIALAGNLTDIAFIGETLYGTTGSNYSDYKLVTVDITDASVTDLFTHISDNYGPAIGYDYFNGNILKFDRYEFTRINGVDLSEEIVTTVDHPGECHAVAMKNPTTAIVTNYEELYEFDLLTNTFTYVTFFPDYIHALAFGQTGLAIFVDGPTTFCVNEPSTLFLSSEGDSYQWLLDGVEIADATDETYVPTESGVYTCNVDGTVANGVSITVMLAPEVSFTATPNPVFLSDDPTGTVDFTNTTDIGDTYFWDFDNDFFSASENPSFAFAIGGSYDVELTVTDSETGCSSSATETVVVIAPTAGISVESLDAVSIYPVPATDFVVLNLNGINGQFQAQLTDLNGRVIETVSIVGGATHQFGLSELESGAYLIKVSNTEITRTFQVVKQ